jgi:hypothetical protein
MGSYGVKVREPQGAHSGAVLEPSRGAGVVTRCTGAAGSLVGGVTPRGVGVYHPRS